MRATRIKNGNSKAGAAIEYMAEGAPLPVPNAPGLWLFTVTGSQLRVAQRDGVLYFEAGTWAEEETPVPSSVPAGKEPAFIRLYPVIDAPMKSISQVTKKLN